MRILFASLALLLCLSYVAAATDYPCGPTENCGTAFATVGNAQGTTPVAIFTATAANAGGHGAKIFNIFDTCTQTAGPPNSIFTVLHASASYPWFVSSVSTGTTGNGSFPPQDLLRVATFSSPANSAPIAPITDQNGNLFLALAPGDTLQVSMSSTMTSPFTQTYAVPYADTVAAR